MALLGLKDNYTADGRVLLEALSANATSQSLRNARGLLMQLGAVYKQLNASVGQFGMDTLTISTTALESGSASDDSQYTNLENELTTDGAQRDALASQINSMLVQTEFNNQSIDVGQAQSLIAQGNALLAQVHGQAQNI